MVIATNSRRFAERGFSLVELMVGIAIGLIVVAGILLVVANMSSSRAAVDRTARQTENGRYAIQKLTEDIRHVGFFGEFSDLPVANGATLLIDPCSVTAANLASLMSLPIQPFTAAATPPTCVDANDFIANSNVLILRFASPVVTPIASLDANTMYVQSVVDNVVVAAGAAANFPLTRQTTLPGAPVLGDVRQYVTRMYFLSPCSRPAPGQSSCTAAADEGSPIPTLKMIELAGGPSYSVPVAIAEGVERFEIDYGIDTLPALARDGAADELRRCTTAADACTAIDMLNIVTVNLYVLTRDTESSPDFTDAKVYALGAVGTHTPNASARKFRRHLYSATVRVNNLSMRKE